MRNTTIRSLIVGGAVGLVSLINGCGTKPASPDCDNAFGIHLYEKTPDGSVGPEFRIWEDPNLARELRLDEVIGLNVNRGDILNGNFGLHMQTVANSKPPIMSNFYAPDESELHVEVAQGTNKEHEQWWNIDFVADGEIALGTYLIAKGEIESGRCSKTVGIVGILEPGETYPPIDSDTNGTPREVECHRDYDCGRNGFVGEPFCTGNNVTGNYQTFTCDNPGEEESYCTNQTTIKVRENCKFGCEDRECKPYDPNDGVCTREGGENASNSDDCKECLIDSECGTGRYEGNRFCDSEGNARQNFRAFHCTDWACGESTVEAKLIGSCNYGCASGSCMTLEELRAGVDIQITRNGTPIDSTTIAEGTIQTYSVIVTVPNAYESYLERRGHVGTPVVSLGENYVGSDNCFGLGAQAPLVLLNDNGITRTYGKQFDILLDFNCPTTSQPYERITALAELSDGHRVSDAVPVYRGQ